MKFPRTIIIKPNNYNNENSDQPIANSNTQIIRVLATSIIDLVNELISCVTITPKTLKDPILNIVLKIAIFNKLS